MKRRGPHNAEILPQRIGDLNGLAQGRIRRDRQSVKHLGAFKRVGHTLMKPAKLRDIPGCLLNPQLVGQAAGGSLPGRQGGGDIVIPKEPRHLLGNIRRPLQILAERRRDHLPGLLIQP